MRGKMDTDHASVALLPRGRAADRARSPASCHPNRRAIDLATGRTEIDAARFERVDRHGVTQDIHIAVLWGRRLSAPPIRDRRCAIDTRAACPPADSGRIAKDGHDIDRFRFMGMGRRSESRNRSQIAAHSYQLSPASTLRMTSSVFACEGTWTAGVHGDAMDTVSDSARDREVPTRR